MARSQKCFPPRVKRIRTSAERVWQRFRASAGAFTAATEPVTPRRILGCWGCVDEDRQLGMLVFPLFDDCDDDMQFGLGLMADEKVYAV
mmetsp:Transcript_1533/g.1958  ORF Transcript_1533/g.1958 Transcript_1533/m.1958 type:complete len:89 (-) Transcript_1533:52-318(-)